MKNTYEQHGKTGTRLYVIWGNLVQRCTNPINPNFPKYGGRGITICDSWRQSFHEFSSWAVNNGYSDVLTVDRIDNNQGYSAQNCRWADYQVQAANRNMQSNNRSGYIGVSYDPHNNLKKWLAGLRLNGKRKNLGRFRTAIEAAQARDAYITQNNLTNYTLNGVPGL